MNKKLPVLFIFALLFVIPLGVVAQTASPGSTITVFGIPVTQTFTGLTASTAYHVVDTTGTNVTWTINADTAGEATITVTPAVYGQNTYAVCLAAGSLDVLLFSIENMDIMPYIIILITISILFSVLKMFTGKGGGLF